VVLLIDNGGLFANEKFLKMVPCNFIYISNDKEVVDNLLKIGGEVHFHVSVDNASDIEFVNRILKGRSLACICALGLLEYAQNPFHILKALNVLCKEHNVGCILSVINISHRNTVFKLMEGKFEYAVGLHAERRPISFFTHENLSELILKSGFVEVAKNDFMLDVMDDYTDNESILLAGKSLVHAYLKYVKQLCDPHSSVYQFIRFYLPTQVKQVETVSHASGPFLSIVIRTQGNRPETFKESLLCLAAQTNTDFEILVIGHKITQQNLTTIEKIIKNVPPIIKDKIFFSHVQHGNRTPPLNEGLFLARGKYVAFYDDDDLIFDHWVEAFHEGYLIAPGKILHAYCVGQKWRKEQMGNGDVIISADGGMSKEYCVEFSPVRQLLWNKCPLMSLAFPLSLFKKYNIKFDETLTTTEDWDYLMRVAAFCGVHDIPQITSIYRSFEENSQRMHSQEEWKENKNMIQEKLDLNPMLFPAGFIRNIKNFIDSHVMKREVKIDANANNPCLQKNIDKESDYWRKRSTKLEIKYYFYKLLKAITIGNARCRYTEKWLILKKLRRELMKCEVKIDANANNPCLQKNIDKESDYWKKRSTKLEIKYYFYKLLKTITIGNARCRYTEKWLTLKKLRRELMKRIIN